MPAAAAGANIEAGSGAEVGSTVTLAYPMFTVACKNFSDADKVYLVYELTMRKVFDREVRVNQTPRDKAVGTAMHAARDAQKDMMTHEAFSCSWAEDVRYHVEKKTVSGSKDDLFYVVQFCLKPDGKDECLWVNENYTSISLFATSEAGQPVKKADSIKCLAEKNGRCQQYEIK